MISNHPYEIVNHVPMSVWHEAGGAKVYLVHTESEFKAFFELLMQQKIVFCDTETSGFHYFKEDRICGSSFGWGDTHFYIPCRHLDSVSNGVQITQLSMDWLRPYYILFFSQRDVSTVWHNAKFDIHFYRADGIYVYGYVHDTRILWALYNENAPGALKVIASGWRDIFGVFNPGIVSVDANSNEKTLSNWRTEEARARRKELNKLIMAEATKCAKHPKYQGWKRNDIKAHLKTEVFADHIFAKSGKEDVHYGYIPIELMTPYAGVDTFITQKLFYYILDRMPLEGKTASLYDNEMQLSQVIMETEEHGMKIDRAYLEKMALDYERDSATLATSIDAYFVEKLPPILDENGEQRLNEAGQPVLPTVLLSSPEQLGDALVAVGVPLRAKSKNGNWVVDKGTLLKHEKKFPIVKDILELRRMQKLKSTYFDAILTKLVDGDILHANFNQNVSTGRMSSNDPNLQNQPRGNAVRNAFICPNDDYIYLFADYSQIEVRLTAHFSQDAILLDSYRRNQDVHCRTAGAMFGVSYEEMVEAYKSSDKTNERYNLLRGYRNIGKTLNFGLIYGVSAQGLSEQIPHPPQYAHYSDDQWIAECEKFIKSYFHTHVGVKRFINKYSREIKSNCYIENDFGRIRHLPHAQACKIMDDHSLGWMERRAQRQGVNFLVQGTAGDLFKTAVVRVHKLLEGKKSYIVNFVHDEIQIYLHKEELYLLKDIKHAMQDFKYKVPIIADFSWSKTSWGEKKDI